MKKISTEMNLPSSSEKSRERAKEKYLLDNDNLTFLFEAFDEFPQNIFLLKMKGKLYWGRKLISKLHKRNELLEMHCSLIEPHMVLGLFQSFTVEESGIRIFFDSSEKVKDFDNISEHNDYIDFPFSYLNNNTLEERVSPKNGWRLTERRKQNLSRGEAHIRAYVLSKLSKMNLKGNELIYDPACSTGVFLSSIKEKFPEVSTFGQDISEAMIREAKKRVDFTSCGCASLPASEHNLFDFVFIRFLNSEVVNREFARKCLPIILESVRPNGIAVIFGHTPVLLPKCFLENMPLFTLETSLGLLPDNSGIFQYYTLRKHHEIE